MNLNENTKLSFIKTAFKNIDDTKPDEVYKARANLLGQEFKNSHNENEIKRNEWFFLLRCVNGCIQFESEDTIEQEKIFNDLKAHPYFSYYKGKELLLNLFLNRKPFQELLKSAEPEIAQIFFGLYHLHIDIRFNAQRDFDERMESQANCVKFTEILKKLKAKFPLLFDEYLDMFQYCMAKAQVPIEKEKVGFFKQMIRPKNLIILLVFIVALLIFFGLILNE